MFNTCTGQSGREYTYGGNLGDEIAVDCLCATRERLQVPQIARRRELIDFIESLISRAEGDFPHGKWATIQHLESQLTKPYQPSAIFPPSQSSGWTRPTTP
jgi:hypothetical protein